MGFLWAWLALLLHVFPGVVAPAHAQGSRKDDIVFNSRGIPLAGATVRVCAMPASGQPCLPLALIYSDAALTQALANPTTTDGLGNYSFYAAPGKYEIEISGPGITTKQLPNVILPNDPSSPTFSGISAFSLNLSGNLTVNGNTSVIGNLASGTLNLANQSTPPGAAGSGTVSVYTKTADKLLYYKDETGTETGPLGAGAQTNVSNNWAAQQNFNANQRFKGPNPYVDITAFGARAVNPNTTPAAVGLTANCTNGSVSVTISSASTFVNGDGVALYGCGAPHGMSTPSAPTVTPSLSTAGTGTLLNTPGPTGATTYNYRVIARDRNGGLTAPSTTGSTATGAAALGAITVNVTSMSRSGQTVTVTTAAAHGFLVGCSTGTCGEVFIGGGNALSDTTFRGWFSVTSAADTTHFTFTGPPSTALGASTSATGGTATFYSSNLVCVPSGVAGAVYYAFYSDRASAGTFALIGVSNALSASGTQDLCVEDFGSPMMDNQTFPAIFPTSFAGAGPPAATSDSLSTTIASGAGTTTLTLADAAGTTVSGATIRLDAVPAIQAAAASITSGYGTLHIPADASGNPFVINSWLQLSGNLLAVSQSGALWLNDTIETASCGQGCAKWIGDVLPQHPNSGTNVGWSPMPRVSINSAHPGFFISGSPQAVHISHINVHGVPVNGTLGILTEAGQNITLDWVDCDPGSGVNDYMSSCFQFRLNPGNNSPGNITLDFVGMSPGGGADGVSHTPTAYCRNCGNMIVTHAYSVHRGMLYWGNAAIQLGVGGVVYINGGGSPLLTTYSSFGSAVIGTIVLDTIAHPCVAALTNGSGLVGVQFVNGTCAPSSGVLPVSGNYSSIAAAGSNSLLTTFSNQKTLITTSIGSGVVVAQDYKNTFDVIGPSYASFINNVPMAAPACSVGAGGSLTVGSNYTFFVVPVWQNGQEGQPSPQSSACTPTSGNQTITINWSTAPGNPKGYDLYYCITPCGPGVAGAGASSNFANPQSPAATSLVWSAAGFNTAVASGVSRGGPTMLMSGTQGISTPALAFAGSSINPPASGFTAPRNISFPDNSGMIPVSSYQNNAYDNATRANGAIGSNWTVTNNGINISSNSFVGTASTNDVAYWAVNTFSPAQFSQVTLTALNGTTDFPGTAVLLSGSGGATHGYSCVEDTTNIFIQKITGTTNTTLTSSAATGTAGDILRLEVDSAGNLTCYKNGVSTLTASDTTYTSGSPGLFLFGTVATSKNWRGGNLHPLSHLDTEQDWTRTQHFTQGIALGGSASESFNNSPRAEQNIFLPGALTSTWTGSTWTTDKPITITRVQAQAKTAPSGCTTNAIVRLTDGTTPVNVTISAAANDSGAIAQNYAAGSSLTVAVQTAAAGCTTSPADANVTVQYRMQ